MKRIILFFAVCLGLSVSQTTFADDAETVRAASKRATTTNTTTQQTSSRSVTTGAKRPDATQNSAKNTRTAAKPQQRVVSRTTATPQTTKQQQNVKPRTTGLTIKIPKSATTRVSTTSSRAASARATTSRTASKTPSFSGTTARSATGTQSAKRISRAAELNNEKISNIKSLNYSKCKTVYYECMDEFCANKDTNLRRCACSARIHEFDNIKKQLADVEDKMLDFNQRLLTVSMDKEDAAAINVATAGELGYQTKDTSQSEKLLQKITDSLNDSGNSRITNDLAAVSLSLDLDTAWDDVDAMSGVATSAKSGVDLYNAAHPICIEMAREVCNDDELDIAQNGYKLTIQQDCDTVSKFYKTQYSNTMEKVHESGALLDISRLNIYQQRNSDDTLTCKKKILDQLSNTSVCGENLHKCLDMTGRYIDPSTGAAFLSAELYNLNDLLQEPAAGEKWSKTGPNESFVKYLNSKKEFLEPAIAQCEDIADMVWQDFMDDALSQIKLAQIAKLEEIRRSCTTLIAECKTNALDSLADFDARALSAFSVAADKTVNAMCSEIQDSCDSLMTYSNDISGNWKKGIAGITKDMSYQEILETCMNVGRDCIVQQCNGTSGNFALCQKKKSDNRFAILKREACWNEVLQCVNSADNLSEIEPEGNTYNGYTEISYSCETEDNACKIAKQIWGDCGTTKESSEPKILTPDTGSTLLSWFASNTGSDSCSTAICEANQDSVNGQCITKVETSDGCTPKDDNNNPLLTPYYITVSDGLTNYCPDNKTDTYGNCCLDGAESNGICVSQDGETATLVATLTCTTTNSDANLCPNANTTSDVYCVDTGTPTYDNNITYKCNGKWVVVSDQKYYTVTEAAGSYSLTSLNWYRATEFSINSSNNSKPLTCLDPNCHFENGTWTWKSIKNGECFLPTHFLIEY